MTISEYSYTFKRLVDDLFKWINLTVDCESIAKGLVCNEVESYSQAMMAIVLNVEWLIIVPILVFPIPYQYHSTHRRILLTLFHQY